MVLIRNYITLFAAYLILTGLLYSRVLMSIGMGIIFLSAIINPDVKLNTILFFKRKIWWTVSLLFFIYLLSGLYTENYDSFLERLKIRLPFLMLPFAFASLPPIERKNYLTLFYFFLLLITASAIFSSVQYYKNFEEINFLYFQSKVLPTPVHHIRYSLMVLFSIATGIYFISTSYFLFSRFEKVLQILVTLFLIYYLHLLSSRISLLIFYFLALSGTVYYFITLKKWFFLTGTLILIIITPLISYHYLDSFRHRSLNTVQDINEAHEGGNATYWSIGKRFIAWKIAWEIIKKNPILGVGVGDLKDEMQKYYLHDYKEIEDWSRILPHNQFIHYQASFGIIGSLIFIYSLLFPVFYKKNYADYFFMVHTVIFLMSLFTESTLEDQRGTCFYIFFVCLNLNQLVNRSLKSEI